MPDEKPNPADAADPREASVSRWDTDGSAEPVNLQRGLLSSAELPEVPELSNTDLVHLRIRVIALENMVISLLALASKEQLYLARELATYIFPRPGFTQHPLTVRAAHQMIDLIERAQHFRDTSPT